MKYHIVSAALVLAQIGALAGDAPTPPPPPPVVRPAVGNPAQPPKIETPPDIKEMSNIRYLIDLAQIQVRYNDMERSEETLRKALPLAKDPPDKQQVTTLLGTVLQRKQDWKGAEKFYEDALAQTTDLSSKGQLVMSLSDIYSQSGEADKAEKVLSDVLDEAAKDAKPETAWLKNAMWQRLLGLWRKQEGKLDKVTAGLEAELAKDPQNLNALERLADIYSGVKRDAAKAVPVLEKLAELKPKDIPIQMRLAAFYQEAKQYDKAIAIHKKMLETEPKAMGPNSSYQIANLLLQSGKKDEAIAWAKEHLAGDQNSPNGVMLPQFFEQAGLNAEAMDAYVKLAEKAATPQLKADYLLRAADLARRNKDYAKAEPIIRSVIKDAGEDKGLIGRANQALIKLYEDQGKIGELKL